MNRVRSSQLQAALLAGAIALYMGIRHYQAQEPQVALLSAATVANVSILPESIVVTATYRHTATPMRLSGIGLTCVAFGPSHERLGTGSVALPGPDTRTLSTGDVLSYSVAIPLRTRATTVGCQFSTAGARAEWQRD